MTLATVDDEGSPSARIMLLKALDERGFVFYTNYESRKGRELAARPRAALTFFWKELERQVRIEGSVEKVSAAESDEYFAVPPARLAHRRLGQHAERHDREPPVARGAREGRRGAVRREPAAPAALGRLPRDPRLARVLAGAPEPAARPHRVHARGDAAGWSRASRPRNAKSARLPRPGAARGRKALGRGAGALARRSARRPRPGRAAVGLRLRLAHVEPRARLRRQARGHGLRLPPQLPPVVAHQSRHARAPRPRAHPRARRQLPRARLPPHAARPRAPSCARSGGARCRWAPTCRAGSTATREASAFPSSPSS